MTIKTNNDNNDNNYFVIHRVILNRVDIGNILLILMRCHHNQKFYK